MSIDLAQPGTVLGLLLVTLAAPVALAQDLVPGTQTPAPVGFNVVTSQPAPVFLVGLLAGQRSHLLGIGQEEGNVALEDVPHRLPIRHPASVSQAANARRSAVIVPKRRISHCGSCPAGPHSKQAVTLFLWTSIPQHRS
jgi:hypothetical protein